MSQEIKQTILNYYTDISGAITIQPDISIPSQQNGLMQTGLYISCLYNLELLSFDDEISFARLVYKCEVEYNDEFISGLYNRYPNCPNTSDFDDTRCIIGASLCIKDIFEFEKDIIKYGLKHFFNYNNVNPDKFTLKTWRLYRLDEIAFYFLANKWFSLFLISFFFGTIQSRLWFRKPDYYRLLDFSALQGLASFSKFWRFYLKYWLKYAKLSKAVSDYFGNTHPIVELSKEVEDKNSK